MNLKLHKIFSINTQNTHYLTKKGMTQMAHFLTKKGISKFLCTFFEKYTPSYTYKPYPPYTPLSTIYRRRLSCLIHILFVIYQRLNTSLFTATISGIYVHRQYWEMRVTVKSLTNLCGNPSPIFYRLNTRLVSN